MNFRVLLCFLSGCLISSCATVGPHQSNSSSPYQGLKNQGKLSGARAYQGDLNKLSRYRKVLVERVKIAASAPSGTNVTQAELNRLGTDFEAAIKKEFSSAGYSVVKRKGAGTLAIQATIVDARPSSPVMFAAGYAPGVFVVTAGMWAATGKNLGSGTIRIQAEITDSQTGERFYAVDDEDKGGKHQVGAGLTRWGQAQTSFRKWSRRFLEISQGTAQ